MKNSPKLSISIVNYNTGDYLRECLDSISKVKDEVKFDVYVIDNASTDHSLTSAKDKFPWVKFSQNETNLGFGKAHNINLKRITSEFILFLNPDTKILPGTLKYMISFMEQNENAGAASCKVEKENGTLDWASHRGFPTPLAAFLYFFLKNNSLYHLTNRNMKKPHEVDAIVGAFFLTRKDVYERVGYFDEDYFLYGEDLDLCYRIKKAGYKIYYVPEVSVIHYKGISSGIKSHSQHLSVSDLENKKKSVNYFYEAMLLFYEKHLSSSYPFFINWLVYLGVSLKWALAKRKLTV